MTLLIAPCNYEAAKHAVLRWHYSQAMPSSKLVRFGVWEDDRFIGCVLYGRGASKDLGRAVGLDQTEVCELVRVALSTHAAPVSQIVAASLKQLKQGSPGLRLVVSFADPLEGHVGGIYQAGGWLYTGRSAVVTQTFWNGKWRHARTVDASIPLTDEQRAALPKRKRVGKFRYLMPLDKAMRRRVTPLALPYPRGSSLDGETPS